MNRRLYRSPSDRFIAGVAGGMAESWDLDPAIVRVGWVLLTLLTGGLLLVIYVVMAIVVPLRPADVPPGGYAPPPPGWVPPEGGAPPEGWVSPEGGAPGGAPAGPPSWSGYRPPRPQGDHTGAAVLGVLLIGLGAWLLVRDYLDIDVGRLWPVAVIGLGAFLILLALARSPSTRR
jgi:phage shock protein PspC (stress-responsive transcriptional regulator)